MNSDLLSEISIPKIPAQSNQLRGLGVRDILLGLFVDVKYNVRINVIVVMSQTFYYQCAAMPSLDITGA